MRGTGRAERPSSVAEAPCRDTRTAAGTSAAKSPSISATVTDAPSIGAEKQRELDVAHPETLRVCEHDEEQRTRRDERPGEPRRARVDRGLRDESATAAAGRTMRFGHDPLVGVDHREHDEHRAEPGGERGLRGRAPDGEARHDEKRRDNLDSRIGRRDARVAVPAATAKQDVREHRDVVAPEDLGSAASARRRRVKERTSCRHTRDDDVQEASERERRSKNHGERPVFMRGPSPASRARPDAAPGAELLGAAHSWCRGRRSVS